MTFPMMIDPARDRRSFAPADEGSGAADTTTTAADTTTTTAADTTQTAAKWWEGDRFADPARQYLTAKGLTVDDPLEAMPRLVDIAANAEKRIGRGLDTIIDKPAKDQPYTDWVAKNREALNLPADEKAYKVARPETWPKEAKWDDAGEGKLRAIGVKYGIPQEAVQEIVNFQAETALSSFKEAGDLGEEAKQKLMSDLEKEYGDQTKAVIHKARLGAQAVGEKAGLQADAIANISDVLTEKIGDANTIRFMAVIGDLLGDDTALGLGKGGALTTTPAEARAELARLRADGGDYAEAYRKNDRATMERLRPKMDNLSRIASGG